MNRTKLPYRKNCEGYFFFGDKILAVKRGSYIEFPGGGFNEEETAEKAIIRETKEEAGAIIKNLTKIGVIYFDWAKNWAKTEKQKARYKIFRGEEMHLFKGEIVKIEEAKGDKKEKGWEGKKLLEKKDVADFLNSLKPFPKNMQDYYNRQLEMVS